jgi:hypothetical protein
MSGKKMTALAVGVSGRGRTCLLVKPGISASGAVLSCRPLRELRFEEVACLRLQVVLNVCVLQLPFVGIG